MYLDGDSTFPTICGDGSIGRQLKLRPQPDFRTKKNERRVASLPAGQPVRFEVETPADADIRLIRAGAGVVARGHGRSLRHTAAEPGAYRVEAWKRWRGKMRGWVFSNAIYVV